MGARCFGTIIDWRDEKAFGHIECVEPAGKKIFAHKSDFAESFADGEAPQIGTLVSFVAGNDFKSGRERAHNIRIEGPPGSGGTFEQSTQWPLGGAAAKRAR